MSSDYFDPSALAASAVEGRNDRALQNLSATLEYRTGKMEDREMREVANQFEAMLVRQLIKEMRKTSQIEEPGEGLFNSENSTQLYMDIADDHLADHIAETGSFGISDTVYEFLKDTQDRVVSLDDMPKGTSFMPVHGADSAKAVEDPSATVYKPLKQKSGTDSAEFKALDTRSTERIPFDPNPQGTFVPMDRHPLIPLDRQEKR